MKWFTGFKGTVGLLEGLLSLGLEDEIWHTCSTVWGKHKGSERKEIKDLDDRDAFESKGIKILSCLKYKNPNGNLKA